jgi:hypothetical protein
VFANRDLGARSFTDCSLHCRHRVFDRLAKLHHFPRAVFPNEEALRLKFSTPHIIAIQVRQEATVKTDSHTRGDVGLERHILEVDILGLFLHVTWKTPESG